MAFQLQCVCVLQVSLPAQRGCCGQLNRTHGSNDLCQASHLGSDSGLCRPQTGQMSVLVCDLYRRLTTLYGDSQIKMVLVTHFPNKRHNKVYKTLDYAKSKRHEIRMPTAMSNQRFKETSKYYGQLTDSAYEAKALLPALLICDCCFLIF